MSLTYISNSANSNKTNTGYANKIQTNRFQNPQNQMCPVWNHQDLAGRTVCLDSFYTKYAGCNSPLDRIKVENFLRPAYMNYVTQSAAGIAGVEADYGSNLAATASAFYSQDRMNKQAQTGKFGLISAEAISRGTGQQDVRAANAYQNSQDQAALLAQQQRSAQALGIGNASQSRINRSGAAKVNPHVMSTLNRNNDYMFENARHNQDGNYLALNQMNHYNKNNSLLV
jgi:hypothetical protein